MAESEDQQVEGAAEAVDESEELEGQARGERRQRDFQASAVQNLQRARKSVSSTDAEVSQTATILFQSAVAWALLDLAEAVRSYGRADEDEPNE